MGSLVYIVAGELSGDNHGEGLMRATMERDRGVKFIGYGGPKMAALSEVKDWSDKAAVMGVVEVLKQYRWFRTKLKEMTADIQKSQPDMLVLIDYPKFNLMLAERVRAVNPKLKIVYYISPKVWAWNSGRIPKMARLLDKMICIFPFEVELYEKEGLEASYVGNPIVDQLGPQGSDQGRDENLIGLFPGSRSREVEKLLPVMIDAAVRLYHRNENLKFQVPAATAYLANKIRSMIDAADLPEQDLISVSDGGSHALMRSAYAGVIASGTATLEAAWLGLPYCLVYKIALPTYLIAKLVVKVEHIGLINILAGEEVVEEFIQGDADPCHIERAIELFINDQNHRGQVQKKILETAAKLGDSGVNQRAAEEVLKVLES